MDYGKIIQLVYSARSIALDKKLKQHVELKGEADFVTETDIAVSEFIKKGLIEIAPEAAFVTEEEKEHSNSPKRFILDPIDGTTNLVRGYNMSSISLGYYEDGNVLFGVVFCPYSNELFFAVRGKGAHLISTRSGISALLKAGVENYAGGRITVSKRDYSEGIIEFGAGATNKGKAAESFEIGRTVFENCLDLRRICSTAMSICFIAAGRIDGYFERKIKPWDYAAASLILEEAGGTLSQWDGAPLPFAEPSTIIAGNPKVHAYLNGLLKNY